MLIIFALILSLAALGRAVEPWEINRKFVSAQFPEGEPDAGPVTYFLDPSCTGGAHDIRPVITEIIQMATEGFTRLNNGDAGLAAGYDRIFKVAPDADLELKQQRAMRIFHRISGMVPAPSFEVADIRIYCDNDASAEDPDEQNPRWIPCPDNMHAPNPDGTVNSQLPFEQQIWMDQFNMMYRRISSRGVQDVDSDADSDDSNEGLSTLAQTQRILIPLQLPVPQNPRRETITMGELAFQETATIAELTGPEIITLSMDRLEGFQVVTLFHEFCHSHHILGVPSTGPGEINGWPDVDESTAAVARDSAEAFAFLGLYALLLSRNIKLDDAPSSNLIPLDASQPVLKFKRSQFNRIFLRDVHNSHLHLSKRNMLEMRAVAFVS